MAPLLWFFLSSGFAVGALRTGYTDTYFRVLGAGHVWSALLAFLSPMQTLPEDCFSLMQGILACQPGDSNVVPVWL